MTRARSENKGLTIVAKPALQAAIFLLAVAATALVLVAVNLVMAGNG